MAHDVDWFKRQIAETPEGSQRQLAPKLKNSEGRPMDVASLNKIINGKQPMFVSDAVQLAKAFGCEVTEVIRRAGFRT